MREIRNAKIDRTHLGYEDHGCMTAMIQTKSGSLGQGFGGYVLGGAWGMEFIKHLLKTLEVDSWERLPGTHCRVDADNCKIYRIGHIIEDRWFNPEEDLKIYRAKDMTSRAEKERTGR